MAERRRRRKPANPDDSEESTDESVDEMMNHTLSDLGSDAEGVNSEYESADEEELVVPDRSEEVQNTEAKLDDDEDRKNPQYIPKRGTFYEHDDRTHTPDGNEDPDEERYPGEHLPVVKISDKKSDGPITPVGTARPVRRKGFRGDDKWVHDKFEENEQGPKQREELVATYGYDIRNEEGAPRARRRRRYGRGPNKYTRNWEDFAAYTKTTRGRGRVGLVRGKRPQTSNATGCDEFHAATFKVREDPEELESNRSAAAEMEENTVVAAETSDRSSKSNNIRQHREEINARHESGGYPAHTYTNQEFRRSKAQDNNMGNRGRARGTPLSARGGRGRGFKRGGGPNFDDRASEEVRVTATRGASKRGSTGATTMTSRNSAPREQHPGPPLHAGASPAQFERQSGMSSPVIPAPPPAQHYQQHPSPKHLSYTPSQDTQLKQKRYSSQRPPRVAPVDASLTAPSGVTIQNPTSPHYSPHPHHNLYYQDTSASPPPEALAATGLPVPSATVDPVVFSSGTVIYDDAGNAVAPVTSGVPRHLPSQAASLPSTPFVAGAPAAPAPPNTYMLHMPRNAVPPRLYDPSAPAAAPAAMLPVNVVGQSPVVAPSASSGVTPVLAAQTPIMTGAHMPVAGGTVAPPVTMVVRPTFVAQTETILAPGFSGQPPPAGPGGQFPAPAAPHPQSYPATYQPFNASAVSADQTQQPQEVYRNGVMYYNTQSQQPQRSSAPLQKRPKAAIPIVPPPGHDDYDADKRDSKTLPSGDGDAFKIETSEGKFKADSRVSSSEVFVDASEGNDVSRLVELGYGEGGIVPFEGKMNISDSLEIDPADHYAIQQLKLHQEQTNRVSGGEHEDPSDRGENETDSPTESPRNSETDQNEKECFQPLQDECSKTVVSEEVNKDSHETKELKSVEGLVCSETESNAIESVQDDKVI